MLQTLKNIFSVKDIRKKIVITLFIILLYRLGSFITVPGVNKIMFMDQVGASAGGLVGTINLISGGAFRRFSIFAMTIGPYITASIVLNLLQVIIPSLERLAKEGEDGKKKLDKYTKYLTLAFALVEGLGLYITYRGFLLEPLQSGVGSVLGAILFIGSLVAGTALLTWLGDKITEHGIGNGISIIVFVGIISGIPGGATALFTFAKGSLINGLIVTTLVAAMIAVIAGVIYVQQAERRLPVNYAKRVVGRKMYGGQNTHIPIKVAMAGVMPIIFAMSFLMFPSTIINLCTKGNPTGFLAIIADVFAVSQGSAWYNLVIYSLLYMGLIIAFTFVYTMFIVNPVEMSNQLKKNGGFIPGIRAGKNTSDYISKVLKYITAVGAVFLALVAVLPILLQGFIPVSITFGGTSVLIVVSVALEVLKNLETQMVSRHYTGFLN
ncbi:MAG: preprotein translocase subunit SecY [Clostridia bacterium]